MILGLMFLVMTIIVLMAFMPVIKESLDTQRNYDSLNCKSSSYVCPNVSSAGTYCYNETLGSETTTCLIFDIYLPYIVIVVLIGGVGLLLGSKMGMFGSPQPQQYGAY